jgi:L-alanine-DL-glutamate epimerase-like enolase superfamily enzyme
MDNDLEIIDIEAWGVSFPVSAKNAVRLGVGQALKRDAVVVKVTTKSGIVGWGESHHGRAPSTIAHFINHALRPALIKQDASNVNGLWEIIYRRQLAAMGIGAGCAIAMSGIDMALWDIRAKAVGWPLYKLLGGAPKKIPAYAGGVALGWQDPNQFMGSKVLSVSRISYAVSSNQWNYGLWFAGSDCSQANRTITSGHLFCWRWMFLND